MKAGWGMRLGTSFAGKWAELQGQTWHGAAVWQREASETPNAQALTQTCAQALPLRPADTGKLHFLSPSS